MAKNNPPIETKDCSAFEQKWNGQLRNFAESDQNFSVFNVISPKEEQEPLISFNYQDNTWYAGRYIGSITYKDKKADVTITIKPRFGDTVLFTMFEELFNIKFTKGLSSFSSQDSSYYLKLLISFIWLQKLANANRHGLPQVKSEVRHTGYTLKGRLLIKPTLRHLYINGKAVSSSKEKILDQTVTTVLHQAHQILQRNYFLGKLTIPDNAREAIQQFDVSFVKCKKVNNHDFQAVKYHPMYQQFKDVVDFSWQIINSDTGFSDQSENKQVSGFFLDMAEIWESYIRSVIKKQFSPYGWHCIDNVFNLYPDRFYKRAIIPDIVLMRNNDYCVFDAKYKKMVYRPGCFDLDRNDFFQIHTYISYLQHRGNVLLGGLVYPVTANDQVVPEILPNPLFDTSRTTYFFADGPCITDTEIGLDGFLKRLSVPGIF